MYGNKRNTIIKCGKLQCCEGKERFTVLNTNDNDECVGCKNINID